MGSKCEDLQNKRKTHGHCGFLLANLKSGECVYYVKVYIMCLMKTLVNIQRGCMLAGAI